MRKSHLKFHLIAISLISGIIIVLFMLLGPKPQPKDGEEVIGDRFIQIDNATWGRNCDPYVDEALKQWKLPPDATKATPRPAHAQTNNALTIVSAACNGHLTCSLTADTATLKTEPLESCYKRLTVGYRCYSYDRLQTIEVNQGATLTLDCHEKPAEAPVAPAQP